jgi:hypothetical protein
VTPAAVPDQVPVIADAVEAQQVVAAFESGVRRAQDDAALTPGALTPGALTPGARTPTARTPAAPSPTAPEPADFWPDNRAAFAPVPPAAGSDVRSLNRRVPGATLSPHESAPRRAVGPLAAEQDPEKARRLVEQFESGVARALQFQDTPPGSRQ